jgi:alkylhydroperoxidase family enzyme
VRISLVEKDEAPDVVRRIHEGMEKALARCQTSSKYWPPCPTCSEAFNQLDGAIWADGALSSKLKDLAYLRTSILNGCEY